MDAPAGARRPRPGHHLRERRTVRSVRSGVRHRSRSATRARRGSTTWFESHADHVRGHAPTCLGAAEELAGDGIDTRPPPLATARRRGHRQNQVKTHHASSSMKDGARSDCSARSRRDHGAGVLRARRPGRPRLHRRAHCHSSRTISNRLRHAEHPAHRGRRPRRHGKSTTEEAGEAMST